MANKQATTLTLPKPDGNMAVSDDDSRMGKRTAFRVYLTLPEICGCSDSLKAFSP